MASQSNSSVERQRSENWLEEDKLLSDKPSNKTPIPSPLPSDNARPEIEMMSQSSTDTQEITTPKKKKLKSPIYKLKDKKINKSSASAALQIAETEVACRKELHEMQMTNERQKLKNILLKEEVLKSKLAYYKNKIN